MIQYLLKGFLSVWHLLVRIFSYTFAESADPFLPTWIGTVRQMK